MATTESIQGELRWQQPSLIPPAHIQLTARLVLDGPSGQFVWSLERHDGHELVLEAWTTGHADTIDLALIEIQDRLPTWVAIAGTQLAPF